MFRSIRFAFTCFSIPCLLQAAYAQSTDVSITIDTRRVFQTMQNFGASDAWACQFVGNWPQAKKDSIADWLFSLDTKADGSPKGIALSLWRFNLGGGSTQQGSASGIRDEWRRAESLLDANGNIDASLQAGQQWFLQAAKKRKVPEFLVFLNSPPVQFTKNNKAFSSKAGEDNLDASAFDKTADYIVKAVKQLEKRNGIRIPFISPINEPQWDWSDGGQEGNPASNKTLAGFARSLDAAISQEKLSSKILLTESGHIKYLLREDDKPGRGNQLQELFAPGGAHYVGNLKNLYPAVAAHSYFSTSPFEAGLKLRTELAEKVAGIKALSYWQSEYCILGDNGGEINGSKRDTGINAGLYVAKVMYQDIVAGNATAWQWWLAVSAYDYKDGLVYVEKNKTNGWFTDSKMLWVMGNYSRFVRPGMKRVDASSGNADCLVAAFTDEKKRKLVVVLTNTSTSSLNIKLDSLGGKAFSKKSAYTTSDSKKLQYQSAGSGIILEPRSVTTIVME